MSRPDADGDERQAHKPRDAASKAEPEAEQEPERGSLLGNALMAQSAAGGVPGAGRSAHDGPVRGDPDGVDDAPLGADASAPPTPDEVMVDTLGDPDWTPPPDRHGPDYDPPATGPADPATRARRLAAMQEIAGEPTPGQDGWWCPTGEVVQVALLPWARLAVRYGADDPTSDAARWWVDTAGAGLPDLDRLRSAVFSAAVASLTLADAAPSPEHLVGVRLALEVGRARLDRAEHLHTLSGGGVIGVAELVRARVPRGSDEVVPARPDPVTLALVEHLVDLRPGPVLRPAPSTPTRPVAADAISRVLGPAPQGNDELRREQLAQVAILQFRELQRHRLRVGTACALVADALAVLCGDATGAALHTLAADVDDATGAALDRLRAVGRGVSRPPYAPHDTIRRALDDLARHIEQLRQRWIHRLASVIAGAVGDDLPEPPSTRPGPVYRALVAGRWAEARRAGATLAPTPGSADHPIAVCVRGPRAPAEVMALGASRGNAAVLAWGALCAADALVDSPYRAEQALIQAGAALLSLGEGTWAELIAGY